MIISIDDPHPYYYGGTVAAPVFKDVIEQSLIYLGYVPEKNKKETGRTVIPANAGIHGSPAKTFGDDRISSHNDERIFKPASPKNPELELQGVSPQVR